MDSIAGTSDAVSKGDRVRWTDNDGSPFFGTITDVYDMRYYQRPTGVGVQITWDDNDVEHWPWPHIDLELSTSGEEGAAE